MKEKPKTLKSNRPLDKAKKAKADEFFTQFEDVERELSNYREHFKGKVVYCNCDDPYESNFIKFFILNFNALGLKKLIATSYKGAAVVKDQISLFPSAEGLPLKIIITAVPDAIGSAGVHALLKNRKNTLVRLKGDGDFRSPECVRLLKEADIVCTNPPFSLFREYVAQLFEHKKHFLIVGNKNAITYKEVFKLFKENKLWFGCNEKIKRFMVPDHYEGKFITLEEDARKYATLGNVGWYTNLGHKKRNEMLPLVKSYTPEAYPKYDHYDAIEVSKTADIPSDYRGAMGVPISFLDKYNPEQFEILGIDRYIENNPHYGRRFTLNGREVYARVLIKAKKSP